MGDVLKMKRVIKIIVMGLMIMGLMGCTAEEQKEFMSRVGKGTQTCPIKVDDAFAVITMEKSVAEIRSIYEPALKLMSNDENGVVLSNGTYALMILPVDDETNAVRYTMASDIKSYSPSIENNEYLEIFKNYATRIGGKVTDVEIINKTILCKVTNQVGCIFSIEIVGKEDSNGLSKIEVDMTLPDVPAETPVTDAPIVVESPVVDSASTEGSGVPLGDGDPRVLEVPGDGNVVVGKYPNSDNIDFVQISDILDQFNNNKLPEMFKSNRNWTYGKENGKDLYFNEVSGQCVDIKYDPSTKTTIHIYLNLDWGVPKDQPVDEFVRYAEQITNQLGDQYWCVPGKMIINPNTKQYSQIMRAENKTTSEVYNIKISQLLDYDSVNYHVGAEFIRGASGSN
jgi:hypothetical protein